MKTVRRNRAIAALALAASVSLGVLGTAAPASAAALASGTVWSQQALTLTTTSTGTDGASYAWVTTAHFADHTATSVRVTSFSVCYSGKVGSAVNISPYIRNAASGHLWGGEDVQLAKGTGPAPCYTWTVDQTFTAGADGEVFRIVLPITAAPADAGKLETISAYYR
jgi:hypothetical protein